MNQPRTREGKFTSAYREPRGKAIAFRLPASLDSAVREVAEDDLVLWIQQAIAEKLERQRQQEKATA